MFALERVMAFQNEKESIESVFTEAKGWDLTFIMGCYQNIETLRAFAGWLAAKAQAVPEGFVLVKKELPEQIAEKMAIDRIDKPRHENDPVWREIAEQSYKDQVKSKKWEFWRDYKAMIEAQEQKV